jgi:hypothetical protein
LFVRCRSPPTCAQIGQVAGVAEKSIAAAVAKQAKKEEQLRSLLASTTDSRQRTDLEAAVKNEQHKQSKLLSVQEKFQQLKAGRAATAHQQQYSLDCWLEYKTKARSGLFQAVLAR